MSAPGCGEAGVFCYVVGDHRGGDFVHLEAAVGFGNLDRAQAEVAGLLQQISRDGEILVLHLLDVGNDFVLRELFRSLADELMLLGEILGGEDFVGAARFKQETAAGNLRLGDFCGRGHSKPFNY